MDEIRSLPKTRSDLPAWRLPGMSSSIVRLTGTSILLYPSSSTVGRHGVISRIDLAGRNLVLAGVDLSDIGRVPDRLQRLLRSAINAGEDLKEAA